MDITNDIDIISIGQAGNLSNSPIRGVNNNDAFFCLYYFNKKLLFKFENLNHIIFYFNF